MASWVEKDKMISFGSFRLISAERLLIKDGTPVSIGGRALDVLIALTDRAGEVVEYRDLINLVWPGVFVEEANLRVHVSNLRKTLGDGQDGSRYILNVAGRGYSFVAPVQIGMSANTIATAVDPVRPRNLPPMLQSLVGRNETVTELSSLLLSQRFVSIIGPGGIGKTTIAVAVAHTLQNEFGPDGVCFVDLGSLTDLADASSAVASALGCVVRGLDPESYIRAFLADKTVLVLLDSCEHVIESVASLCDRLIREAPSVYLLATSREALRIEGENVHLLMPLESPVEDAPSAAQALSSPAVQLFMDRATSSGHQVALSDSEAPVVADICRRLDGIPLAIELVASRVGTYGIKGTDDLLESGAGLFLQGRRGALPRHQTLHAMLDWSFALLSKGEQQVLARLSVFVGQFTLDAAKYVAEASGTSPTFRNAIASLTDKSLIRIATINGSSFYRLLDTTRAYAAVRLLESGDGDAARTLHARYFNEFLKARGTQELISRSHDAALYAPHIGNIRQALSSSFSASHSLAVGVELAARAAPLLLEVSLFFECREWCRRALRAMHDMDRGSRRELDLQRSMALSSMYVWDNSDEAKAAIERGLELTESLQDTRQQVYLLVGLNFFLTRRGDFSNALEVARRSTTVAMNSGRAEKVMSEWMLGASHHLAGDQSAALRHCEAGLRLASDGTPVELNFFGYDYNIRGLASFSRSLWLAGFPDHGYKVAYQAINGVEGFEHPVLFCTVLLDAIPVLQWYGDLKGAAEQAERVIEHATKYSLAAHRAVSIALKGDILVSSGDASSGVALLREALAAMDANHHQVVTLATLRALAEGLASSGRLSEALDTIDEAAARAQHIGETMWLPDLQRARGEILLATPQTALSAAQEALLSSIESARQQSALSWELKAAIPLARTWSAQARKQDAHRMLDGIYRRFTEGFGTADLLAARMLLDELGEAG